MLSCFKRRLEMSDDLLEMSTCRITQFNIIKQPRRYFRFRYRSELGSTSHGVLQADSSANGIEYPTVRLVVPPTSLHTSFYIICTLYEKSQTGRYQISPHQLIYKRDKEKDKEKVREKEKAITSSRRNKEITAASSSSTLSSTSLDERRIMENYEFGIVAEMIKDSSSNSIRNEYDTDSMSNNSNKMLNNADGSLVYTFELRDCFIQKTLSNDTQSVLEAKCKVLRDIFSNVQYENKYKRGPDGCVVYLGFTVCTKNPDTANFQPFTNSIYSEAIRNGQNVAIEKIINSTVSGNGGDEIVLVISGIRKADVQLRLYTYDCESTTIWEQYLQKELIFERKNMITFKVPRYDGDVGEGVEHINCFIEAIRPSDNVRSVPVSFLYKVGSNNGGSGSSSSDYKQTGVAAGQDSCDAVIIVNASLFVPFNDIEQECLAIVNLKQSNANKYLQMLALNNAHKMKHERNNSIFHELVATGNVSCLYKLWHIPQLHNLMRYAINSDGENLLHYACKFNRSEFIHPLLALGDMLCGQDSELRTPLHVAIQEPHHDCVQQFASVLKCHKDYPEELGQLRELFFLHNADGYTVLHLAVMKSLPELLDEMVQFCIANQMELGSIRTTGLGNSILHVAVVEKLTDMVRLIISKVPDARFFTNNDHETVFDMKPISKYENVIKILRRYM